MKESRLSRDVGLSRDRPASNAKGRLTVPKRAIGPLSLLFIGLVLLSVFVPQAAWTGIAAGNVGCPGTTNTFGVQSIAGDCLINADTTWGNGTLTIAGNLIVSGVRLSLWNLAVRVGQTTDGQYQIQVRSGSGSLLDVHGGTLTSTNAFYWSSDVAGTLRIDNANISKAGHQPTSHPSFYIHDGSSHQISRSRFSDDYHGNAAAVIVIAGPLITSVDLGDNTFDNTGKILDVVNDAPGATIGFHGNLVRNFDGNYPVLRPQHDMYVIGNTFQNMPAGGAVVSIDYSATNGGPSYPSKPTYGVWSNAVTYLTSAITNFLVDLQWANHNGLDIENNTVVRGAIRLMGKGHWVQNNNVSYFNPSASVHGIEVRVGSLVDRNVLWEITSHDEAGIVVVFGGNNRISNNRLFMRSTGVNAMGIEIFETGAGNRVTGNDVTWLSGCDGCQGISYDNEYADRNRVDNNTAHVLAWTGTNQGECLQGGGVTNSIYEYNSCYSNVPGAPTYGIYNYINANANNVFQYNYFSNTKYSGLWQTGGSVVRNNRFTNLTIAGPWMCPNAPCGGTFDRTWNLGFNNNTFSFRGGAYATRMDPSNAFDNTFIGHGASKWTTNPGFGDVTIYGGWLYFANATISQLTFANHLDGSRGVTMIVGGRTYWDSDPGFGASDDASFTVKGAIDRHGSAGKETVFWALNKGGQTKLDVTASGVNTFTLTRYSPLGGYNISVFDALGNLLSKLPLTTDLGGGAAFNVDFGGTPNQRTIVVDSIGPPPPPDKTPPAQVTDLRLTAVGTSYVVVQWTAPGDDGAVGRANTYDFRYSTSGPLSDPTFSAGTRVSTNPPGIAGTTETLNVTGLSPATQYWFAVKTADEVPNWATTSNSPSATTWRTPDLPPVARATIQPSPASVGQLVTFDCSTSSDADGTIASCAWTFGDGATANGQVVTHSYSAVGLYTVGLTVTDNAGLTGTTTATLSIVDTTAPAQVTDLRPTAFGTTWVNLQWTAPGGDGIVGRATSYDLRYSTSGSIGAANFSSGTLVPTNPPGTSGTVETLNASGFSPATRYWFALRTADQVPNWSPVSNNAVALTLQAPSKNDTTGPVVRILNPWSGSVVSGSVWVLATATDDTSVSQVKILINSTVKATFTSGPYAWVWSTGLYNSGKYTLSVVATDPAANQGRADIDVKVSASWKDFIRPRVKAASYDATTSQLTVSFTEPMDRASVEQALGISAAVPFVIAWENASSLRVLFSQPLVDSGLYTLRIAATAADQLGNPLAETFEYQFAGSLSPFSRQGSGLWALMILALTGGWIAVIVSHARYRHQLKSFQRAARKLLERM